MFNYKRKPSKVLPWQFFIIHQKKKKKNENVILQSLVEMKISPYHIDMITDITQLEIDAFQKVASWFP